MAHLAQTPTRGKKVMTVNRMVNRQSAGIQAQRGWQLAVPICEAEVEGEVTLTADAAGGVTPDRAASGAIFKGKT